jgi:phosphoribosyl 1,2-cyclic phosphodiesterase
VRFASLGSGSAGNALVVESGTTRVLLDCGFGLRETSARLSRLGLVPSELEGILVTHEHDDHVGGVFKFASKFGVRVWLTHGTLRNVQRYIPEDFDYSQLVIIDSHTPFSVNELEIHPFPVPHDAGEPVQYVFHDGVRKLGVLTDTGCSTAHIEKMLDAIDALALECNHDLGMLMNGAYSWPLKQRISGRYGHLDNHSSAELLGKLEKSKLQHVVALHLSEKNNTPQLAASALAAVMGCSLDWIGIASQHHGFDWHQIL